MTLVVPTHESSPQGPKYEVQTIVDRNELGGQKLADAIGKFAMSVREIPFSCTRSTCCSFVTEVTFPIIPENSGSSDALVVGPVIRMIPIMKTNNTQPNCRLECFRKSASDRLHDASGILHDGDRVAGLLTSITVNA